MPGTCCLTIVGTLDMVAPHSLHVCPSSQVAPLETQRCGVSQKLGWAVILQQTLLPETGRGRGYRRRLWEAGRAPGTSKTSFGRHTGQLRLLPSLPFGGQEKIEQSESMPGHGPLLTDLHVPPWAEY